MAPIIEGPPEDGDTPPRPGRRVAAFAMIWLASLAAVALVSYLLRSILFAAG